MIWKVFKVGTPISIGLAIGFWTATHVTWSEAFIVGALAYMVADMWCKQVYDDVP